MSKPNSVLVTVLSSEQLTPNMRRLTLSAPALSDFADVGPGSYIKLMFCHNGEPALESPDNRQQVQLRTYSVRRFDRDAGLMTVDFVLHDNGYSSGPASSWASRVQVGERIRIAGPGRSRAPGEDYDWVLFYGDMTALPAIAAFLEQLPAHTIGFAVLKIRHPNDRQVIENNTDVKIIWLSEGEQSAVDCVSQLPWPEGQPFVWAATEFSEMRSLRQLFRQHMALQHHQLYISSYWREGRAEDQHKIDKQRDQQRFEALEKDDKSDQKLD